MIIKIIILTFLVEIFYIFGRIIFGSMKERYKGFKFKYKLRIHHGYTGIFLILIYLIYSWDWLLIVGLALLFSDAIHHFIVLPIWIGKTEFP